MPAMFGIARHGDRTPPPRGSPGLPPRASWEYVKTSRHHLAEAAEEVGGIVRACRRLGVILHARGVGRRVPHALDRVVVEIPVGDRGRRQGPAAQLIAPGADAARGDRG